MKPNNPFLLKNLERNGIIFILVLIIICFVLQKVIINVAERQHANKFALILKSDSTKLVEFRKEMDSGVVYKKEYKSYYGKNENYTREPKKDYKKSNFFPNKKNPIPTIEINNAGQLELEKLPGIGAVLGQRIIKLREALGGYYKIEQIAEVYGVERETFEKIRDYLKCNSKLVKTISFNTATLEELQHHPYISQKLAYQIINYRTKVGQFKSLEDTKQLYEMTPKSFERLSPYIGF